MIDPQAEYSAVLSDESPIPVAPSDSSSAALIADADDQVSVKQLGQGALFWRRFRRHKVALIGAIILLFMIVLGIMGPYITPETWTGYNPLAFAYPPQLDWRYLFGSDTQGHAILAWVLLGIRTSLEIGFFSAALSTVIGILIGAIAGYFGGFVDAVMMRVTDVFLTLPFLPTLLVLVAILAKGGPGFIIFVFAFLGWSGVARLIRPYYLTMREQEFVEAARAVGVSSPRIIFRHIMPNALSPIVVAFTLAVAAFISGEAAVDFLGVGLSSPNVSLGLALASGNIALPLGVWWATVFPGLALLITILAVNFLGDGLRDALDVKAKAD